jgi:membrane protein DedA with SNARE-associated domain
VEQLEAQLLLFIQNIYNVMGWPGVVALMALDTMAITLPSEVVMPLAGWMLVKAKGLDPLYILLAGLYGGLGSTIGSALAYSIGAWGGRPLLYRYGKYLLISHHDLEVAERWFARYGELTVFFSRLMPVMRSLVSLPAGVVRMSFIKFLIFTFIGSFIWSTALAFAGYQLGEHWGEVRAIMRPFDLPILAVIIILIAIYIWHRLRPAPTKP